MKYLFDKTGQKILESLAFTNTLYAFDFDGTLAPIVSKPENAGMSSTTMQLIQQLSEVAPVAIISGRSISDLKKRIKLKKCMLIGNHGLEGLDSNRDSIDQVETVCSQWLAQLNRDWKILTDDPGTFIENKKYSLALHYRKSRNKKNAKLKLFDLIQRLSPSPRVILGKSVMNLVPAGAPHKGVALLEIMLKSELKCAYYIGDDDTDEDVFSLPDDRIITTRVGKKKLSQAQFFINSQNEINKILKLIINNCSRTEKT